MKEKRGYSEGISMDIGKLKEKLERVTAPGDNGEICGIIWKLFRLSDW
jgi:hypothetical protein